MPDLSSILTSANDLRVGAIAQPPFCADPDRDGVQATHEHAAKHGYDHLPVRDDDGVIRRVVPTRALEHTDSWAHAFGEATSISTDQLAARDAPVFSLLERLQTHEVLFTLGRDGVDGVVTIFDLNQPAAHLLGFGLALICESEIARILQLQLGDEPQPAEDAVADVLGAKAPGLRRYRKAREADANVQLSASLMFGEKLKVLSEESLEGLAERRGVPASEMKRQLEEIKDLRNAIGHSDNAKDRLADPHWVHARMTLAYSLARWIADSETAD